MTDNERIQSLMKRVEHWKMECYHRDIEIEKRDKTIAELAAFIAETAGADQTLTTVDEIARIARATIAQVKAITDGR